MPPTTPPAMAPTGVEDDGDGTSDATVEVISGTVEVVALVDSTITGKVTEVAVDLVDAIVAVSINVC